VAPRPIGWISSVSSRGEANLAPYSFFNSVSARPPIVMFSSEGRKDTITFVEETREFVCNLAIWELRMQVNATSAPWPRGVNEMQEAALESAPSILVKPPRVKASPCALECRWLRTMQLRNIDDEALDVYVVLGQVVGVHIDDRFIRNGLLDTAAMRPIARAGYYEYFASTSETKFSMRRPKGGGADDLADLNTGEPA
jgi:flavin reductase (DIM6/NTAB) family NADH-FMN oxidoreductase RutF